MLIVSCIAALWYLWRQWSPGDEKIIIEVDRDVERAARLAARLRAADVEEVSGKAQNDVEMDNLLADIESGKGGEL